MTAISERAPLVEILYFDGCPNHEGALVLVEKVAAELGVEADIRLVNVPDSESASRLRFLGSPTVRIGKRDVEPGAEERTDFALSCRVFRTGQGFAGQPDERWVREALRQEAGMETTAALQMGLEATGIPSERLGQARTARLSQPEREFYFWILRSFAAGARPEGEATRTAAARFGLDADQALAVLAREDLVHADTSGRPRVAYPFSAEERGHRVLIDEHWVEAMCAIDALGIAPMLKLPIEVVSRDPVSGGEVWVRLDPAEGAWWEPTEAVVLAGSGCCEGPRFSGCCDVLNFFETRDNAERYLRNNPSVSGVPISIPAAIELGRVVFGGIFKEG